MNRAQINNILENARVYRQKGEFSRAIEQLMTLPAGPQRDGLLAETFNDQGDQLFIQQPPNYEGAVEAYQQALTYDKSNPKYGNHLGEAYYRLAKEKSTGKEAERYFALARRTYEAVLQSHPQDTQAALTALTTLTKIAIEQRDDVLLADSLRKIIEAAPDGQEAENARRDLRSRGFRP